jgi:putative sigma-54 modulation protein
MKVIYTGRTQNFTAAQQKKLNTKFAKLGKQFDRKGEEKEARVILTVERHLHYAEITVRFHDRPLACIGTGTDQITAILAAAEKLESQALKLRTKWRDTKRTPKEAWAGEGGSEEVEPEAEAEPAVSSEKRVFRVNQHARRKPMTLDEALIEMEGNRDYLVYRDAETDRLAVLLRRRDGNYDLVEA